MQEVEFSCSGCGQRLLVTDPGPQQQASCPNCGLVQSVPSPPRDEPPTAAIVSSDSGLNPYREDPLAQEMGTSSSETRSANPYAAPLSAAAEAVDFAQRYNLASRSLRLIGAVVDLMVYAVSTIPAFVALTRAHAIDDAVLRSAGLLLFLAGLLGVATANWILIALTGQSLAKRLLGMRIVKENGEPPGFVNGVILRHWVVLFFLCVCYPIGFLVYLIDKLVIFGPRRQCFHDVLAGTLVVSIKPKEPTRTAMNGMNSVLR